ncbi:MAG: hypothetical protein L0H83_01390 [Salinisphaera sp.]|nr:hypothetical protein [Salinisphaera sp.]
MPQEGEVYYDADGNPVYFDVPDSGYGRRPGYGGFLGYASPIGYATPQAPEPIPIPGAQGPTPYQPDFESGVIGTYQPNFIVPDFEGDHWASETRADLARAEYEDWKRRFRPLENELIGMVGDAGIFRNEVGQAQQAVRARYGALAPGVAGDGNTANYGVAGLRVGMGQRVVDAIQPASRVVGAPAPMVEPAFAPVQAPSYPEPEPTSPLMSNTGLSGEIARNRSRYGLSIDPVQRQQMTRALNLDAARALAEASNRTRARVKNRNLQIMAGGLSASSRFRQQGDQ